MGHGNKLLDDIWAAIEQDLWMWIVVWGQPRTGKTTIQLKVAYEIYKDWDLVLNSVCFNLNGILTKMRKGDPKKVLTNNGLHNRVPILLLDDFGAQCNKAKTQHEPAWDIFKGAFDTLATKVAVLMASMGNPSGATQQLQEKYTHEVYIETRGKAKYDKVVWQQNFAGWQARQDKTWLCTFDFENIPMDVYKQYDEMRMSLVDELIMQIGDAQIENEGLKTFRRLTKDDVSFIELLNRKVAVSNDWINDIQNLEWGTVDKRREEIKRCKAWGITVPQRKGTVYYYELTDFGFNMLQLIEVKRLEGVTAPNQLAQTAHETQL